MAANSMNMSEVLIQRKILNTLSAPHEIAQARLKHMAGNQPHCFICLSAYYKTENQKSFDHLTSQESSRICDLLRLPQSFFAKKLLLFVVCFGCHEKVKQVVALCASTSSVGYEGRQRDIISIRTFLASQISRFYVPLNMDDLKCLPSSGTCVVKETWYLHFLRRLIVDEIRRPKNPEELQLLDRITVDRLRQENKEAVKITPRCLVCLHESSGNNLENPLVKITAAEASSIVQVFSLKEQCQKIVENSTVCFVCHKKLVQIPHLLRELNHVSNNLESAKSYIRSEILRRSTPPTRDNFKPDLKEFLRSRQLLEQELRVGTSSEKEIAHLRSSEQDFHPGSSEPDLFDPRPSEQDFDARGEPDYDPRSEQDYDPKSEQDFGPKSEQEFDIVSDQEDLDSTDEVGVAVIELDDDCTNFSINPEENLEIIDDVTEDSEATTRYEEEKKFPNETKISSSLITPTFEIGIGRVQKPGPSSMKSHKNTNHEMQCRYCWMTFQYDDARMLHEKFRHSISLESISGLKKFTCEFCPYAFKTLRELWKHRKLHTGDYPFKCSLCSRGFIDEVRHRQHLRMHQGIQDVECPTCFKIFSSRKLYKIHHQQKHKRRNRSFQCYLCRRKYISGIALQKHILGHHGGDTLECHLCGRDFTSRQYLALHMRSHVGKDISEVQITQKRKYTKRRQDETDDENNENIPTMKSEVIDPYEFNFCMN